MWRERLRELLFVVVFVLAMTGAYTLFCFALGRSVVWSK